jgi:hypothetical protein
MRGLGGKMGGFVAWVVQKRKQILYIRGEFMSL